MKNLVICMLSVVLTMFLVFSIAATHTQTKTSPGTMAFRVVDVNFANDVNNLTVTLGKMYGFIDAVVIDSAGTDTAYAVYVKDEHTIPIFSKTDCTSASEPYRYNLDEPRGVPISGQPQVQIADANNATMTNMVITLYMRDWQR